MEIVTEKKQRRINTDKAILDAARIEIGTCGYTKAKLSNIAKRANISIGMIGQNFGNKENLLKALMANDLQRLAELFYARGSENWRELFGKIYDYVVVLYNDRRTNGRYSLKLFSTLLNDSDSPKSAFAGMSDAVYRSPLIEAIKLGQKNGEVKDGDSVRLMGLFFRTLSTVVLHCNQFNIQPPCKEWFIDVIKK